ncbi:MAG: hypothetical protein Q4B70_01360 [Lachnospiraceae bacterium]|nr:hypothetical protein [Lachnospiraceae bacterium]
MKKRTIIISCIGAAVLLAGGTAFGINRYQYSKNVVDVVPVELLSSDWGMDSEGSSGTVTNSMSQEVAPDEELDVKKIYVEEGQTVKIGDKLLAYDMAEKKLDLELKGYDVKQIEFSITKAEKELSNLKKGIVSDGSSSSSDNSVGRRDPLLASLFLRSAETTTQAASESTTAATTEATTMEDESPATTTATDGTTATTQQPSSTTTTEEETKATAYSSLTSDSKAYKGDGTEESPYRFLCTSDCKIKGSFINMIRGYNGSGTKKTGDSLVVILEVRKGNKTSGSLIKSLTLYGDQETKKNKNSSWTLDSYISGEEDDDTTTSTSDSTTSTSSGTSSSTSSGTSGGTDITYTKSEINDMIKEKETDLADLKLDLKEAQLEYDTLEKEVKDGTVTAVIDGIVKEVRDPEEAAADGSAVITVSSEGGLYVKGAVDEFSYSSLSAGSTITASSWDTGNVFEAKVIEVSSYPVTNSSYYYTGTGNPNVSYYPFTALIEEESSEVSSGESVTINFNNQGASAETVDDEGDGTSATLYIPLAYVRTENNQSYVYVRGSDKKLEKRYVTTGQSLYNYVIEIKQGLTIEDYVAFPYGTTIKDGAKTKISEDDSDIVY